MKRQVSVGVFDPNSIQMIMSGERKGLPAGLLRSLMSAAEPFYSLATSWRNRRFDRGGLPQTKVDVPVISVGNITTGGTGKTPMVAWLAKWFRRHEVRVSLVSRGYRAEDGAVNDEALELELQLPDVPHLQNPRRVEAARTAIEELDTQLILMDDGFQHRHLARDLDIVLLDAVEPFGYNHVLPRGLLRESLVGLQRADLLVLTRADAVAAARRAEIREIATRFAPQAQWCEVEHEATHWCNASNAEQPLDAIQGQRIAAFCGIGNPAGFRHSLSTLGVEVVAWHTFPDHHSYSRDDIEELKTLAQTEGAEALVCTRKDLVKIGVDELDSLPLWALTIGMQPTSGIEFLEQELQTLLERIVTTAAE